MFANYKSENNDAVSVTDSSFHNVYSHPWRRPTTEIKLNWSEHLNEQYLCFYCIITEWLHPSCCGPTVQNKLWVALDKLCDSQLDQEVQDVSVSPVERQHYTDGCSLWISCLYDNWFLLLGLMTKENLSFFWSERAQPTAEGVCLKPPALSTVANTANSLSYLAFQEPDVKQSWWNPVLRHTVWWSKDVLHDLRVWHIKSRIILWINVIFIMTWGGLTLQVTSRTHNWNIISVFYEIHSQGHTDVIT